MSHFKGLHHISVLAGDPKENFDFYVKKLGLRMVKKSVNQDDPGTYHLFYGNEAATPGSSITFFPWPRAHKGSAGTGEAVNVAFRVPQDSREFWLERLNEHGISHSELFDVFGKTSLRFQDPDGLELDLVFDGVAKEKVSTYDSTVPHHNSIQGFESTRLKLSEGIDGTIKVLTDVLGFSESESEGDLTLFSTDAPIGSKLIIEQNSGTEGKGGRGIVHHVAFRAENEADLANMREQVLEMGLQPTGIIDRHWFKSVYFRVPGGVLFEMATDDPGYAVDEDFEHLGEKLILPPWLEPRRPAIEQMLPEISL
ncbi:MAG TPA: ring-cleaving dioxygenase [Balneolaceae bacterium]|nr:ring-cleaving dioxygenase [Balneolaceae bacterium]|tara:strand:- start:45630 stop:46562 length:933 start_codon:yes stop_codon:yes gene_type:complete